MKMQKLPVALCAALVGALLQGCPEMITPVDVPNVDMPTVDRPNPPDVPNFDVPNVDVPNVDVPGCPNGQTLCGMTCANLTADRENCGMCGNACAAGQVCSMGMCMASCGAGLTNCNGSCKNLQSDPTACGMCDTTCMAAGNATAVCRAGACNNLCNAGFGDCDGNMMNGCETSLNSPANCGACGAMCRIPNANATCMAGGCGIDSCQAGFADCDRAAANGCEVNTQGDRNNCGACGMACGAGQVCSMGVCVASCRAGLTDCNGSCRDLQNDPAACGMCGTACAPAPNSTPVCGAGSCRILCSAGFGNCDGVDANGCETALADSAANCGACGRTCNPVNAVGGCSMGMCQIMACNPGFADCDGNAANGCEVNTQNNVGNCGACGNVCNAMNGAAVCNAGVCGLGACNMNFANCNGNPADGCESNLLSDATNCSMCGRGCTYANAAGACNNAVCALGACNANFANCDMNAANGCETATNTVMNCGMCGRACTFANATAACMGGNCALAACSAGFANCDGMAANGCETNTGTDRNNCGACGTVCPVGQSCSGGACRSFPAACTMGGPDANANSPWVVCRADANTAWIAPSMVGGCGPFRALAICQGLGYARVSRWGGTCGSVCGYCNGNGGGCMNPQANTTFDSGGGDPRMGGAISCTVHWECSNL